MHAEVLANSYKYLSIAIRSRAISNIYIPPVWNPSFSGKDNYFTIIHIVGYVINFDININLICNSSIYNTNICKHSQNSLENFYKIWLKDRWMESGNCMLGPLGGWGGFIKKSTWLDIPGLRKYLTMIWFTTNKL